MIDKYKYLANINYTLSIDNGNKTITKKADNKSDFLRIVMMYSPGSYSSKLNLFNDLIKESEKQTIKI